MGYKILDIHTHPDCHGYNPERLIWNMDMYGIAIACLLSWEAPANECDPATRHLLSPFSEAPVPFERCVAYMDKASDRFWLGYAPDPRLPDSLERLKSAINLYDVCLYGELKLRMMYDNPDAIRIYRFCGEKHLPVLMHFDYETGSGSYPWPNYWYGGGIDALERVLALCPETNFIGHAPGFWAHISNDELYKTESYPSAPIVNGGRLDILLEKYPNLYCDISANSGYNALNRDHEFSKKFIEKWQDRVIYGRDLYTNIHQDLLSELSLSEEILEKIYLTNACRLVGRVVIRKNLWINT